jgi:gluconolactonase
MDFSRLPVVLISKVKLIRDSTTNQLQSVEWQKLRPPPAMIMPAGGTPYKDGILYCSQGNLTPGTGGLFYMPHGKPPVPVVTNFYGREFNSPRHVAVSKSGLIWFTDPALGHDQEFRNRPFLPGHVYCFDPKTQELSVMADGFGRPTGLALSPDEGTLYVSDTDANRGDGAPDLSR